MIAFLHRRLDLEHDRLILFAPVCMAAGILLYFHLTTEPPLWPAAAATAMGLALSWMLSRHRLLQLCAISLMLAGAGFCLAYMRTHSITPVNLTEPMAYARISGTLASVEATPKGSKIIIEQPVIESLPSEKTPRRISLTLRKPPQELGVGELIAGQHVSLKGGLFPPPQEALPGGFDFARYYYFKQIGAVGYGLPPLTVLPAQTQSSYEAFFANARQRLGTAIRSYFNEPAGSIAAAFATGQTLNIPTGVNEEMRVAGLYHLLAVSGMNLSVVAGLVFFSVRLLLACIPFIALRYPIKKWAAICALFISYIYLEVAGSPVSAQRAFLMVSLIFIAILLDRSPAPMRSIAASAFLILCWTPEALLSASFQLSYSATAALIVSYEWGVARLQKASSGFGFRTLFAYFAAVMLTSLVAWLGTEPFIIYNFNQFSSYSLLANTLAEPLVSFILMPLLMAGLLLMPLGLAWLAFTPMQYGVDLILSLSHWVAGLPYAMVIVPAPTDTGFLVAVTGLIWLYLWRTGWRWMGVPVCIGGMLTAFAYQTPDILISNDGKHIAARLEDGRVAMLKGRKDSFIASQWAHAFLEQQLVDKKQAPLHCDAKDCALTLNRHSIALPKSAEALADDCAVAQIIIAPELVVLPENCTAPYIIDKYRLSKYGSASIQFNSPPSSAALTFARSRQENRPWTLNPSSEGAETDF